MPTIADQIYRLQNAKASLKASLESKGATIDPSATIDTYSTTLDNIPVCILQDKEVDVSAGTTTIQADSGYTGLHTVTVTASGGGNVEEKTVNFIDFDGTLVASYTGVEAQALTDLPDAPDHSTDEAPLTFDEWNWTLAEIKSYNTSYPDAIIWVGANYHPTDGKTHLFFNVVSDKDEYGVHFNIYEASTVEWGDGSEPEEFPEGDGVSHVYKQAGRYHCKIETSSNQCKLYPGISIQSPMTMKLTDIRLSASITKIYNYGISYYYNLKTVSLPSTTEFYEWNHFVCTDIRALVFPRNSMSNTVPYSEFNVTPIERVSLPYSGYNIIDYNTFTTAKVTSITIAPSVTSIGTSAFENCRTISKICIPNTVTSIGSSSFRSSYSLEYIRIPSSVTNIGSRAFEGSFLTTAIIEATTPPTLQSSNTFNSYRIKHIYVPAESVDTYKAATNWDNFTSIIEAIPS